MAGIIPTSAYFRLKAEEFGLRLKQAQAVILNHNLSVGLICEDVLRTFLRDVLPGKFKVSQGFIGQGDSQSRQCDVIIYDCAEYAPSFSFGSIEIIPAEAVKAVIEVKATIDYRRFQDVLKECAELSRLGLFKKYLFCYDTFSLKAMKSYFFDRGPVDNDRDFVCTSSSGKYDVADMDSLPDGIVSIKKNFFLHLDQVQTVANDYMGYNCYSITDRNNEELASLQQFLYVLLCDLGCYSDSLMPGECFGGMTLKDRLTLCPL